MGGQMRTDEPFAQWELKAVAHYLIWFQVVIVNHVSKWEWQRVYVVRSGESNEKNQRKRKMIKGDVQQRREKNWEYYEPVGNIKLRHQNSCDCCHLMIKNNHMTKSNKKEIKKIQRHKQR